MKQLCPPVLLACCLLTLAPVSAATGATSSQEARIELPAIVKIRYPKTIRLVKSGCQTVPFRYATAQDLPRDDTVFVVQILNRKKTVLYGEAAWFSRLSYRGDQAPPAMPRVGTLNVKICSKPFTSGKDEDPPRYSGVVAGTHVVYFAGGLMDPETGERAGDKIEAFGVIKIIKWSRTSQ